MRVSSLCFALGALLLVGTCAFSQTPGAERDANKRMVLVELYTSQGCDMCPAAEKILGALAEREPGIVPVAFHVDYFNDPWKDVFSDPLYSQRQMIYNQLYTKPKNREYGLYYTPMLMIDGERSVNGRDPDSAIAAIREARSRKPAVAIDVDLALERDGSSGTAAVRVTGRSSRAEKTPLLVVAVLREDGVVTEVPAGENAGKSLVARFPARRRNSGSSSSTAARRRRKGTRSRSTRGGIGGTCGWPCSCRTSAPARCTRRPTSPGDRPRESPPGRRRGRRPPRTPMCVDRTSPTTPSPLRGTNS